SGYLLIDPRSSREPLPPKGEYAWWYQYYFATERGRAGYDRYRRDFARLVWQVASPKWRFDDATFDRSAAAFDNCDPQLSLALRAGGRRSEVRCARKKACGSPGHHR